MTRTPSNLPLGSRRLLAIVWSTFALASALVIAGCSGEPSPTSLPKETLHPVKGKVVTAVDKPLTDGEVTLVPEKSSSRPASGKIGPDGTFTLKSGDQGEGAAEGQYRVKISSPLTTGSGKTAKRLVPLEYEDEDSSQLKVTIKSGSNDLTPFKLVPVKAKSRSATTGTRLVD